jgi:hypothetical protein
MVAWEPAIGVEVLLEERVAVGAELDAVVLVHEASRKSDRRHSGASEPSM